MEKYYIKTFGCKLNVADSFLYEKVLDLFLASSSEKDADFILVNSCGVIDKTERKIIKKIKEYKKEGKFVVLTGCLPSISDYNLESITDEIFEIKNINQLEKILKKISFKEKSKYVKESNLEYSVTAVVPISDGCLGNCTYCGTKIARPVLKSRKQEDIIKDIKDFLDCGYKEIQLTSQDLAVYGIDRGEQELPELLEKIVNINKFFRLRLGMTNPGYTKKILPELLKIYENEKIYKYIHAPVQSGDDNVLERMNRKHTVSDFVEICNSFYKKFNNFVIATDIIIGFPEESKENFERTYNLIKEMKPHIVNITRFSPRTGTMAAKMKDISPKIKKERSRTLNKLTKEIRIAQNKTFVNKKYNVLITQKGKNNTLLTRLPNYKALIVKKGEMGQFNQAIVDGYKHNYLYGYVL